MRRIPAALGVAALFVVSVAWIAGTPSVRAQQDPASRALLYLQGQQSPQSGGIPAPPGSFSPSELYAIGAAAAGYDPTAMRSGTGPSVIGYLTANASAACGDPGACGELAQAVTAAGLDPRSFGGLDLVSRILAGYKATTGAFGSGEAFTQALAVQGLVAAGVPVPAGALAYIRSAQDSDGGWDWLDIHDDPNPNDFATSDTNSTAMSLMALDAAGAHGSDASALAWLRTQQDSDGGFPYQAGSGSDPDSTALVVQAITGSGGDPGAASWTRGRATPVSWLAAAQAEDGGYTFPGNHGPDAFTTSQVPLALLRQALPARTVHAAGFTPAAEAAAALRSLLYLQVQLTPAGGFSGVTATYDPSELFAIDAAAAGFDPNVLRRGTGQTVMQFLAANAAGASSNAGACGRLIEAVLAAGLNPHAFGGVDLVAREQSFYTASTGRFGDGEAFTQTLAIQALLAAGVSPPSGAVAFLAAAQDSDGGWDWLDAKDDTNPQDFASSDTNSTAMALMTLDAAGDHAGDAAALGWLRAQQGGDGGFPFQAGSPSDPDSTALVLQALMGTGQDPAATAWARGGATAVSWLIAHQAASGGFSFPGDAGPDDATTVAVPIALERLAFPVPFGSRHFYQPGATLSAAGPPPTPSPTGAASPTPVTAGVVTPPPSGRGTAPAGGGGPQAAAATASASPSGATPTSPPAATPAPSPGTRAHPRPSPLAAAGVTPPLLYAGVAILAASLAAAAALLLGRRRP